MGGALPRVAPFGAFIALLAAQPLLEGVMDARWAIALRGLVAGVLLLIFWKSYREIREAPAIGTRGWMLAIGSGLGIAVLWVAIDGFAALGVAPRAFVPLHPDGHYDLPLLAARLAGFVIAVPIMEELFWRSFLMRWIDDRRFLSASPQRASGKAFWLSSILFALEHQAWVPGLVAGLVFGKLYTATGNLRVAIASHAVSNAVLGGWIIANNDWSLW